MEQKLVIPQGIEATIDKNDIVIKGKLGELRRSCPRGVSAKKADNTLIVQSRGEKKQDRQNINTLVAHLKNMIKGTTQGFEYKLKVVYAHFPINVTVEGNNVVIKNFLGEKSPRFAEVTSGAKVEAGKQDITIKGMDREAVGQTATRIEQATKIRNRDLRVFQDGIFITSKGD